MLGDVILKIWVIEFQKRGLPHCHLLIILGANHKMTSVKEYDCMVSAELSNLALQPEVYETITYCMVHGPCDREYPNAPCMADGKCSKQYPRAFTEETRCDEDGYPVYWHRNDGNVFVDAKRCRVDNHWIVLHNMYLTTKYNVHINVEIFSSISSMKYLYKYVYKGHDCATAMLESHDEIKQYFDAQYVSTFEVAWRLFTFKLHDDFPSIMRL